MSDQKIRVRYSDDGGQTFTNWREKDLGDTGKFNGRLRFLQMGSFINRVYEIECSATRDVAILGAVMIADTQE